MTKRVAMLVGAVGLAWVASIGNTGASLAQSPTADPRPLIGEWLGSWTASSGRQHLQTGQYYVTIKKVEAEKVHAHFQIGGRTTHDFDGVGTPDGNKLTFETKLGRMEFTIDGDRMRGVAVGVRRRERQENWEIALTKKN